jgi:hypothetical protein
MQRLGKDCRKQYSNCRGGCKITKIKYLFLPLSVSIGKSQNLIDKNLLSLKLKKKKKKKKPSENISFLLNPTSM